MIIFSSFVSLNNQKKYNRTTLIIYSEINNNYQTKGGEAQMDNNSTELH